MASSQRGAVRDDYRHVTVTDPEAAIAHPDIDLVVIASPNDTHFPLAQKALQAGKHVVVDKPFTTTLAEADPAHADMRTLVIIGSAATRLISRKDHGPWVYTPRAEQDGPHAGELALDGDGRFLALRIVNFGDMGAFLSPVAPMPSTVLSPSAT